MRFLILLVCAVIAAPQPAVPQLQAGVNTSAPLELDGTRQWPVLVSAREVLRAADPPLPEGLTPLQRMEWQAHNRIYGGDKGVALSVVLDRNGHVESAKATGGVQRFYEQAEELEKRRVFAPVRDGVGTNVRAHFTDYVRVDPPEEWLDHPQVFPEQVDLSTFRVTLKRTDCSFNCEPYNVYSVTVFGSGEVVWKGGPGTAAPGGHYAKISQEEVRRLVDQVRDSHILGALDKYESDISDQPEYTVSLDVNGLHKKVVDSVGETVGMPTSVIVLEESIDRIAGTERWAKGNADTVTSLAAEHWNFGAYSKDNLQMYDSALMYGRRELLQALSAAHAPVFSTDPAVASPVCIASRLRDNHQVGEMLSAVAEDRKLPQHALDECLVDSAGAGNLELVNLWLKRGAGLIPEGGEKHIPQLNYPLAAAIQGGSLTVVQRLLDAHAPLDPARNGEHNLVTYAVEYSRSPSVQDKKTILKLLLDAGADPNQETKYDKPALFSMNLDPDFVPLLVAGGAKVNLRDSSGDTPLMSYNGPKALRALLEAGADPALRNRQGRTAAEQFRSEGLKDQADALDEAAKQQSRLGAGLSAPLNSPI